MLIERKGKILPCYTKSVTFSKYCSQPAKPNVAPRSCFRFMIVKLTCIVCHTCELNCDRLRWNCCNPQFKSRKLVYSLHDIYISFLQAHKAAQPPAWLIVQLIEHFTNIAAVRVRVCFSPEFFRSTNAPNCENREFKIWRWQHQRQLHKSKIWLVEWRKTIVLHVRHAFCCNVLT